MERKAVLGAARHQQASSAVVETEQRQPLRQEETRDREWSQARCWESPEEQACRMRAEQPCPMLQEGLLGCRLSKDHWLWHHWGAW